MKVLEHGIELQQYRLFRAETIFIAHMADLSSVSSEAEGLH